MLAAGGPVDLHACVGREPEQLAFLFARAVGFLAVGAQHAHQALRDDADDIAGDDVGQDADVEQPRKRAERRIGVQRGKHLVAGHGGAESHLRGVLVAHLADQDDVGVLPHHASGCR